MIKYGKPNMFFLVEDQPHDMYRFVCPHCGQERTSTKYTFAEVVDILEEEDGVIETYCDRDGGCGAILILENPDSLTLWIASQFDCYDIGIDPDSVYGIDDFCRVDIVDGKPQCFPIFIKG